MGLGVNPHQRPVVEEQLQVLRLGRLKAERRVAEVLPDVRRHGGGTVQDRAVALDYQRQIRIPAVTEPHQGHAFPIRFAGIGQNDLVSLSGQPQRLGQRAYRTNQVFSSLGWLRAQEGVVAGDVIDEDFPPIRLRNRRQPRKHQPKHHDSHCTGLRSSDPRK